MRLVHCDAAGFEVRPGDMVTAVVTRAAPNYLVADDVRSVRHTAAGDLFGMQSTLGSGGAVPVSLGIPTVIKN
jgi:tRNA-2-methylthio-N6-dimethylallyladenosine synthase